MNPLNSNIEKELEALRELTEKLRETENVKELGFCNQCRSYPKHLYALAEDYYSLLLRYEMSEAVWLKRFGEVGDSSDSSTIAIKDICSSYKDSDNCGFCDIRVEKDKLRQLVSSIRDEITDLLLKESKKKLKKIKK
jgi:hypothetical protein